MTSPGDTWVYRRSVGPEAGVDDPGVAEDFVQRLLELVTAGGVLEIWRLTRPGWLLHVTFDAAYWRTPATVSAVIRELRPVAAPGWQGDRTAGYRLWAIVDGAGAAADVWESVRDTLVQFASEDRVAPVVR